MNSAGPQENYAWAIAKFTIRLAGFNAKVERQLRLGNSDKEELQTELDLLFSSSNVLLLKTVIPHLILLFSVLDGDRQF